MAAGAGKFGPKEAGRPVVAGAGRPGPVAASVGCSCLGQLRLAAGTGYFPTVSSWTPTPGEEWTLVFSVEKWRPQILKGYKNMYFK